MDPSSFSDSLDAAKQEMCSRKIGWVAGISSRLVWKYEGKRIRGERFR